jgi:hypothetical protein
MFHNAAHAWELGNNSGNSATMERENQRCDDIQGTAERILYLWGVVVTYPGLYPVFEWHGHHIYTTETLFRDIAQS